MPEGQEGPRGNPVKKPDNRPSLGSRLKGFFKPKSPNPSNRPPTLEEQLRTAGMKTADPRPTTERLARKSRAEQIRNRREELSRLRGEHELDGWGDIETITYQELINNGELEEAEKYKNFVLSEIKKNSQKRK